jgi:Protein of unknown function (DUF3568)
MFETLKTLKKTAMAMTVVVSILAMPLFSGCFALLAGGAIGYEVSPDSVKADFDTTYDRAYDVSLDVAKSMSEAVNVADQTTGWIKFTSMEEYAVAIHVVKATDQSAQVTVSARKYSTPRVQYARNVLAKIGKKLK